MLFARSLPAADLESAIVLRGRYGVLEAENGRLKAIHLRRWPKFVSALEIQWLGRRLHDHAAGDRCLLYYDQPWRFLNFLALKYVVSYRDCRLATVYAVLDALDDVARLKRTDAILCDAWNWRISDRVLARRGWQAHKPSRWHRHYIKRFYGVYPTRRAQAPLPAPANCRC